MRALLLLFTLAAWQTSLPPAPFAAHVIARSMQPGEVILFDVTATASMQRLSIEAFGRHVRAFSIAPDRWRALVGVDLDVAPGEYPVRIDGVSAAGAPLDQATTVTVVAKEFPTRELKVDPRFVTPPAAVLPRIRRETATLVALWHTQTPGPQWQGAFIEPIAGVVVSGFGVRSVFNGAPRAPHGGADFASPAGTPVKAPNAGTVVLVADLYFTGRTIVVDHGEGLLSLFAHLSRTDVAAGSHVSRGDVLGAVGATGRVTGPHLHWSVRLGGARVDPMSLIWALQDGHAAG